MKLFNSISDAMTKGFESFACRTQKLNKASVEWQFFILVSLVLKVITAAFGIFAGFNFIGGKFSEISHNTAVVFGFMFVAIIEVSNAVSLGKGVKMFLFKKYIAMGIMFFLSLILFSCSFYISTEGLASWKTTAPREKIETQAGNISAAYTRRMKALELNIEDVRKNTWKGKLNPIQESRIMELSKNIETLEREKIAAIDKEQTRVATLTQKVESIVSRKANEFYNIAAAVMVLQLLGNIGFAFLLFIVQEDKEGVDGRVKNIVGNIGTLIETALTNVFIEKANAVTQAIQSNIIGAGVGFVSAQSQTQHIVQTQTSHIAEHETQQTPPPQRRSIGFNIGANVVRNRVAQDVDETQANAFNTQADSVLNAENSRVINAPVNNAIRDNSNAAIGDIIKCANLECSNAFVKRNIEHKACCASCRRKVWALARSVPESFAFHHSNR